MLVVLAKLTVRPHIYLWRQQSLPLLAEKTVVRLYHSEEIEL